MDWTSQQDSDLRRIWVSKESLKSHLHLFGDRNYPAVVRRAHVLKLGRRPHNNRGATPFASERTLVELKRGPGTVKQLSARTGLCDAAVGRCLTPPKAGKDGRFHITDWLRRTNGGCYTPVYAYGPGENAPLPTPKSNADLCRDKRSRQRATAISRGDSPRSINPFATAAGFVNVPTAPSGRVYHHLWDEPEEIAA